MRGGDPHERLSQAQIAFAHARAEGVVIGCGSDVGVFAHGDNRRELELMVAGGHERERGAAGGDLGQRRDPRQGGTSWAKSAQASSPTSSRSTAIRPRTSPRSRIFVW